MAVALEALFRASQTPPVLAQALFRSLLALSNTRQLPHRHHFGPRKKNHCIDLKDILALACATTDCHAPAQTPDAWKERLIDLTTLSPGPTAAAWQGSLMRALRHSSAYVRVTFHQIPWALQCLRAFYMHWRFAPGSLQLGC